MNGLQLLRYRFSLWRHPRPLHLALESSALRKLSQELILYVASFLSPDSAASMSLSCRHLYLTLAKQYLQEIKENEEPYRRSFLVMLERDLPDLVLCYYCEKFHSIQKAKRHVHSLPSTSCFTGSNKCWEYDDSKRVPLFRYPRLDFSSVVFQMTMKRHRQGLEFSKLLDMASYTTGTYIDPLSKGCLEQGVASAKIKEGSFLYREQRVFSLLEQAPIPFPQYTSCVICPHYTFKYGGEFDHRHNCIRIAPGFIIGDYRQWKGLLQCKHCYTEFRIDFKDYGENSGQPTTAVFITKWKDFGLGAGLFDEKWQAHSHYGGWPAKEVTFERGSVCAAFEGEDVSAFKFEGLLVPWIEKTWFKRKGDLRR